MVAILLRRGITGHFKFLFRKPALLCSLQARRGLGPLQSANIVHQEALSVIFNARGLWKGLGKAGELLQRDNIDHAKAKGLD